MSDFLVPDLGEGLEDATVTSWSVAVGDTVELNQTLCTLETAKAQVEIPSPYAGRVTALGGAEGDVLAVGAVLVQIDTGIDAAAGPPPELSASTPSEPDSPKTNGAQETNGARTRNPVLVGYGTDAEFDTSRRRARAKPSVRRLAAQLRVDLEDLPAGPGGVVSRESVLAAAHTGSGRDEVSEVRGVRAEMARRMTLSRRQIPDAHASVDVDCTRLLEVHERLSVSAFALTLRLAVLALTHHRVLNSMWVDGPDGPQVHSHPGVHLGVAVAAPRGLLVPVVRDADGLTTRQLADEVSRLVDNGRAGTLKPVELQGSTFTVSNFGALGLDRGVPVINPPEVAILGMGAIKPRAVVIDGAVAARSTMTLTCAFDHRVADGAQAGAFLSELRSLVESPETALLDL
ncbi:dihydrolipoamide acetyltransferase family protein [Mycobacterium sp. ACS4331]|uniref:dihydrolipoamide acetyltransferase family protein n=1 Tax=Mycobacterium sp. ACS4331 TaxID=1834121 RepID=UPI0007FF3872|nr:dihydrolipoamide acetyltransferase family protein [Mycobacterium sp. ACS4331]OBF12373.1 branched-chain alpha-keto acid dehydrogenase subunit E2 [Mycobacterium sp. ACS4331]